MATPTVAIVDYGTGNLFNVRRACESVGLGADLVADPDVVARADALILPGVGAMPDAMRALRATGLAEAVVEAVGRGTPLLGICLGMQLLMSHGTEFEDHEGLGLVPGRVVRFPARNAWGAALKVPHIGWNAVWRPAHAPEAWSGTPMADSADGVFMYFVHSYVVVPDDAGVVAAVTEYEGYRFCSALAYENVVGCQFHPERSGPDGLALYARFARDVTGRRPALSL